MSLRLVVHPTVKSVAQRKHKVGEEKKFVIDEEVEMLFSVRFITETKYPAWLANVVMIQKNNNK